MNIVLKISLSIQNRVVDEHIPILRVRHLNCVIGFISLGA